MEEIDLQSFRTGATLFNGQPTDTGTPCHCVGVASNMPSIQQDKDGVSVENVHTISESLLYNYTNYRQDNPNFNPSLLIRDEAKNNFIKLTFVKNTHFIPVTSENIRYKWGDKAIVTEGDFEGIQDRVDRIAGQHE